MKNNSENQLSSHLSLLLAITCAVVVANMYYVQPIVTHVAKTFNVSAASMGVVTMLTQIGYALGLLLIVPLGDVMNKRQLIIRMSLLSSVSLVGAIIAPNYICFAVASFFVGLLSIVPQIIIPYGAVLAGPANRGSVTGKLLGGLLFGILLSRTVSGVLASYLSWRMIYVFALIAVLTLAFVLWRKMPDSNVQSDEENSYLTSLKSMPKLIKEHKVLREASVNGFFMFGTFSVFWSTLVFYVSSPAYNWGSKEAGLLAIFGLSGALAAPIVGRLSDNFDNRSIVLMGIIMEFSSFIILGLFGNNLFMLIVAILLLDVGSQFGQVANQTRILTLGIDISNRTNTVFMFSFFVGGSLGSLLGSLMWQNYGWLGVVAIGLIAQILALISHFVIFKPKSNS